MEEKICTKCGRKLPATNDYFPKNAAKKDGLNNMCKECSCIVSKIYYKANKEKRKNYSVIYQRDNKSKVSSYKKKYYEKNKYWLSENISEYKKKNIEKYRVYNQNRKARIKMLENSLTLNQWENSKAYFKHACAYCGRETKRLEQDHFIPLSNGGIYAADNIVPACKSCNSSKKYSDFFEWYPKQLLYSKERENKIITYLNGQNYFKLHNETEVIANEPPHKNPIPTQRHPNRQPIYI